MDLWGLRWSRSVREGRTTIRHLPSGYQGSIPWSSTMPRIWEVQSSRTLQNRSADPTVVPGENGWHTTARFLRRYFPNNDMWTVDLNYVDLMNHGVIDAGYLEGSTGASYIVVRVLDPERWEAALVMSRVMNLQVVQVFEQGLL
jgi:hypothetical protein